MNVRLFPDRSYGSYLRSGTGNAQMPGIKPQLYCSCRQCRYAALLLIRLYGPFGVCFEKHIHSLDSCTAAIP